MINFMLTITGRLRGDKSLALLLTNSVNTSTSRINTAKLNKFTSQFTGLHEGSLWSLHWWLASRLQDIGSSSGLRIVSAGLSLEAT